MNSRLEFSEKMEYRDMALETLQALNQIAADRDMPLIDVYKIYLHLGRRMTPIVGAIKAMPGQDVQDFIRRYSK